LLTNSSAEPPEPALNALLPSVTRFLTFEVGAELYALRTDEVSEVLQVPAVARVPQGPPALLGVANLRGTVLPVASLRALLGKEAAPGVQGRAIVLDVGAPVAIVVDSVATLATVDTSQIKTVNDADGGSTHLIGLITVTGTGRVARVLDVRVLLDAAFTRRASKAPRRGGDMAIPPRRLAQVDEEAEMLVTFEVAGQEFALPLESVQEILPAPAEITAVARAEAAVLGITSVRDRLLPLLSLRTLLGFAAGEGGERQKVVVLKLGNSQVGLIADRARTVLSARSQLVDQLPAVLAARTGGESRISAVYRGDGGRRLISILSPEQLFRNDVMQRLTQDQRVEAADSETQSGGQELIFLVFRLGGDEFGLPIDTVVEVAQVPEQITRVPRTPKFLEGVVNLRGEVLPIVDQRRRFEMPPLAATAARRLVVVRTARHRAGIIVDSVSDVLRTRSHHVEPPPELTDATSRLVQGLLNLQQSQRMVLLLDPTELLTRAEQGLLDTFQASRKKADA
jgi:purine-binding chemotaxis protein CheW